jgi:hypothetical protein
MILVINIDFETESNSTLVFSINSPVLVEAETDSKNDVEAQPLVASN